MPSLFERLEQFEGASDQSDVPEWRRYLDQVDGGGGDALAALRRGGEDLQRARQRYETTRAKAQVAGTPNPSGKADPGLLTSAFRGLSAPISAVTSGARELIDAADQDPETQASLQDFREQFNDRQMSGELFGVLQSDEDDPLWERVLKGTGSFVSDVALDPLTYVSFGGSVLGKQAASRLLANQMSRHAPEVLADDVVRQFADETLQGSVARRMAQDVGLDVADDASKAQIREVVEQSTEVSDEATETIRRLTQTVDDPQVATEVGARHVGYQAAEAFQARGARGLRQFLKREFGDDTARELMGRLPDDFRGGVRLRLPFATRNGTRNTLQLADGEWLDRMGLGELADKAVDLANRPRAWKVSQMISTNLNGANGDIYGKMVADVVSGRSDDVAGTTYGSYATLQRAQEVAERVDRELYESTNQILANNSTLVDGSPNPDEAYRAYREWMQNPRQADVLRETDGVYKRQDGMYEFREGMGEYTESEMRGIEAALSAQDQIDYLAQEARDAGLSVAQRRDYVARILSDRADVETKGGNTFVGSIETPPQGKQRQQFIEPHIVTDDAGRTRVEWEDLTPDQIEERTGRVFFETEPDAMVSGYMNAMRTLATRARFAQELAGSEATLAGATREGARFVPRQAEEATEAAQSALDMVDEIGAGRLKHALDTGGFRELIAEATNRVKTTQDTEEQFNAIRNLKEGLEDLLDAGPMQGVREIEDVRNTLSEARSKLRESIRRLDDAAETRQIPDEATQTADEYLAQIGRSDAHGGDITGLPTELDGTYAPEHLRNAVDKYLAFKGGPSSEAQEWIDRVYRPYLSMFKSTATIGRGPGFHTRNMVGGAWNNFLVGVGIREHSLSATLQRARWKAARQARKEFADEIVDARDVSRGEALDAVMEDSVIPRANQILEEEIGDVMVDIPGQGQHSLYDIHRASVAHDVGRQRANLEAVVSGQGTPTDVAPGLGGGATGRQAPRFEAGEYQLPDLSTSAARKEIEVLDEMIERGGRVDNPGQVFDMDDPDVAQAVSRYEDIESVEILQGAREEILPQAQRGVGERVVRRVGNRGLPKPLRALGDRMRRMGVVRQTPEQTLYAGYRGADKGLGMRAADWVQNMPWMRMQATIGGRTESFLRDAAFISGLKRYGWRGVGDDETARVAGLLPKGTQFDYQDLSETEAKWLRGFALPFYTWTRNNVPLQFRGLFHEPGKMAGLMKAQESFKQAVGADEQELVPEWMRDKLGFTSQFEFGGNPVTLGIESPATQLNEFFQGDDPMDMASSFGRATINMGSPVFKAPLEFATGRDFFTGASLEGRGVDAPIWYRALSTATGNLVPTWRTDDGEVQADPRITNMVEQAFPYLGQSNKWAGILGVGNRANRAPSEAIRQLFPVIQASTLTPEQEEGALYARTERIQEQLDRTREDERLSDQLGLSAEQIRQMAQAQEE